MSEVPVYTINPEPQTRARQAIETYVAADSAVRAAMLEAISAIQEDEPMQATFSLSLSLNYLSLPCKQFSLCLSGNYPSLSPLSLSFPFSLSRSPSPSLSLRTDHSLDPTRVKGSKMHVAADATMLETIVGIQEDHPMQVTHSTESTSGSASVGVLCV